MRPRREMRRAALLLLIAATACHAYNPCIQPPTVAPPTADELPLCGNGLLDPGEVCDDGNRIGNDGCDAWCGGFDLMTKPCTLAGQTAPSAQCLTPSTLPFGPSQAFFCNLNAIAEGHDGTYAVVADGGLLVRIELFTDALSSSLSILPATLTQQLTRFCSLQVLPDASIVAHECQEQSIVLLLNGGTQLARALFLPLLPSRRMRAFRDGELVLLAGLPQQQGGACVQLHAYNTTSGSGALLASLECIAYNVFEGGLIYSSFSMDGMIPYQVTRGGCPFQMMLASSCYVVHMERSDMQILKAYVSVDGGLDVHYTVSTNSAANVLGAPLITTVAQRTYTLTGNCFTSAGVAPPGIAKQPPLVTLGIACGALPASAAECNLPLNNPFITDVAASLYLLPQGLSSQLQHQTLLSVFNATQLPLYRQVLDNTHNGTVPIDMVELSSTGDVLYITGTTVGLISTKGIMHIDIFNPGYCRATHAIRCPTGSFGAVGGVCQPCSDADVSVSAQIQCAGFVASSRRRLLSGNSLQSPPFTHMGLIVSRDLTQEALNNLTNYYLMMRGHAADCGQGMLTEHQPYNMQADYAAASLPMPSDQLIPSNVAYASAKDSRDYSAQISDEYLVSWTAASTGLIDALHSPYVETASTPALRQQCGISDALDALLVASRCNDYLLKDFHQYWLPRASRALLQPPAPGRRLLSLLPVTPPPATQYSSCTFMSTTAVSYGKQPLAPPPPPPGSPGGNTKDQQAGSGGSSNMWVLGGGLGGGLLLAIMAVVGIYCFCGSKPPPPTVTEEEPYFRQYKSA